MASTDFLCFSCKVNKQAPEKGGGLKSDGFEPKIRVLTGVNGFPPRLVLQIV
jgi:hypothetical protein